VTNKFVKSLIPLLLLHGPVFAADPSAVNFPVLAEKSGVIGLFSEVRLGAMAHDPWSPERGSADIQGEILFAKPFSLADKSDFLIPRLHLGGAVNTSGKTSHARVGLTWAYDITPKIFVEASLGGALHNGKTAIAAPANRNSMGCAAHFREQAGIGYRMSGNWSVIASMEHLSNAGLCRKNRGLTNLGVMVGYRF
jgi:lipid A 3-O-deacylase